MLEWGLRWCELHAPRNSILCLLHRDYRTGNYLASEQGLEAVLDWEFTGWGDPCEDLGWFTARCWRFTRPDLEAGGIGQLEDFLGATTRCLRCVSSAANCTTGRSWPPCAGR